MTIWRNTENRSVAQTVDAAVKLATIGVPNEVLWERVGFSPQEIDRMKALQEQEALVAEATGVPVRPPPPPMNGQPPTPVAPVAG